MPESNPEDETLFLPSDFCTTDARREVGLVELGLEEAKLWEGVACDSLEQVRNAVRTATALRDKKVKNDRGQDANTRSNACIKDTERQHDFYIALYNHARNCIILLHDITDPNLHLPHLPHLTLNDTSLKSREKGRILGDSRRTDGRVFSITGNRLPQQDMSFPDEGVDEEIEESEQVEEIDSPMLLDTAPTAGTQTTRRKSGPRPKARKESGKKISVALSNEKAMKSAGWIWDGGRTTKMTGEEMNEWEHECNRVQWFRAEAEMERWQEQTELKLAECLRTLRSYSKMAEVWTDMAMKTSKRAGHMAYAKEKAHMYTTMLTKGAVMLDSLGYSKLRQQDDGTNRALIAFVLSKRAQHEAKLSASE
ncbi:hypothetical protein ONZ45_g9943 [Pleurotus djamor]|nr:hypothetical protein ONZ45_g9943 [Pleurotus djamor]